MTCAATSTNNWKLILITAATIICNKICPNNDCNNHRTTANFAATADHTAPPVNGDNAYANATSTINIGI
ncbi:hypothetical protein [Actinophytocola xanthii]|uniref:Uncharacterized protein n=1 Tax=Actinophytocola xanthii TaxID=1912961 RepID=A0A1Q8CTF7_9PSEU|nr:hypothetical protein [Actinophytocola xanthii]OLF17639.1 hypothetical protein BU204_10505 [Actinophytocola xanthii]